MKEKQDILKFKNTKKIFQNEELLKTLCDFIVLKINKFNFNYFLKTIETWAYKGITTAKKAKMYLFEENSQQLKNIHIEKKFFKSDWSSKNWP